MLKIIQKYMLIIALTIMGSQGFADSYPKRPTTFVVPWPPGTEEDILTRAIAEEFQKQYNIPTAVVNKPGGGASVGALFVKSKPADGYTIGSFVVGIPVAHPMAGTPGLETDTFEPVGIFLTYPFVLTVRADAPYNNMQQLAEYAKKNPVKLGHYGYALIPTKVALYAAKTLGFKFSGDAAFDSLNCSVLSSKDADILAGTLAETISCVQSGKAKVIVSQTDGRNGATPNVLTMAEQVDGLDLTLWNGLFVKKGTPQYIKDKIAVVAKRVVNMPIAKELSTSIGAQVYWQDANEANKRILKDTEKLKAINAVLEK